MAHIISDATVNHQPLKAFLPKPSDATTAAIVAVAA